MTEDLVVPADTCPLSASLDSSLLQRGPGVRCLDLCVPPPPAEAREWGVGQTLAERLRGVLGRPYEMHLGQNSVPGSPWAAVSPFVWGTLAGSDALSLLLLEKRILESSAW